MANEIQVQAQGQIRNGGFQRVLGPFTMNLTQNGVGATEGVVAVGVAEADLNVGSVTVPGILFLTNLDVTNYVTYGPKSGGAMVPLGRLKPGETHILRMEPGVTWRWKAVGGTVNVDTRLYQD